MTRIKRPYGPRKPLAGRKTPYRPRLDGKKEHTVIAERALGRALRDGEVVHHVNCDKTDNRPENLVIEKRGSRRCRECQNRWRRESYQRNNARAS